MQVTNEAEAKAYAHHIIHGISQETRTQTIDFMSRDPINLALLAGNLFVRFARVSLVENACDMLFI